jgi:hypothetical protein
MSLHLTQALTCAHSFPMLDPSEEEGLQRQNWQIIAAFLGDTVSEAHQLISPLWTHWIKFSIDESLLLPFDTPRNLKASVGLLGGSRQTSLGPVCAARLHPFQVYLLRRDHPTRG